MTETTPFSPAEYGQLLGDLRRDVRAARSEALRRVNREMAELYRSIGQTLLERQDSWPADAVHRLEADLRAAFPDMAGLSGDNLMFMRRFAEAWPDPAAAPDVAALPWGHIRVLLAEVTDAAARDRFAAAALTYAWSRDDLLRHIRAQRDPAPPEAVEVKARVRVDFHLSPDGQHTLATAADVSPQIALAAGDVVEAYDGDIARLAVVDAADGDVLSLVVLWGRSR